MAESGDWVTLKINGIRYIEKPPLPYWLVRRFIESLARTLLPRTCPTRWPCWGLRLACVVVGAPRVGRARRAFTRAWQF
jgi:4-amino-4-deoxy-L-arabinose transferase-like glycosyltransferase